MLFTFNQFLTMKSGKNACCYWGMQCESWHNGL